MFSCAAAMYSSYIYGEMRYNKTDIDWPHSRYGEIYLAQGSVDNYYLPEANGRGKIVDVLTPKGQIDFTITRIRPVNICFIIPLLNSHAPTIHYSCITVQMQWRVQGSAQQTWVPLNLNKSYYIY